MEWDQITDRWAAMTRRLRSDRLGSPQSVSGPQDDHRTTEADTVPPADKMRLGAVGGDLGLPPPQ
jgi:hypothetical protein